MNQIQIQAKVIETQAIRVTPAGVQIMDLVLEHSSTVTEAGIPRKLSFILQARAVGKVVDLLKNKDFTQEFQFIGFIANTSKKSTQLRLHIQSVK